MSLTSGELSTAIEVRAVEIGHGIDDKKTKSGNEVDVSLLTFITGIHV